MTTSTKHKLLHVVEGKPVGRVQRWKSDAERHRLPLATIHGDKPAPRLPEHGHEALERLLGKK